VTSAPAGETNEAAQIVAAHGRQYLALTQHGERLLCFPRGKRSDLAVGDRVGILRQSAGQAVVVDRLPRQSLLFRSDAMREKLIAANATQVVVVVAVTPTFSNELVTRCLAAAESESLRSLIVLNKADIADRLADARRQLETFARLPVPIVELSAIHDATPLRRYLEGQVSVLVGQSGMGKSTLVNALIPAAAAATREVSTALDSGKHTTTHASLYSLDADSALIDSPGLQEFGLHHLDEAELNAAFVEFRPFLGQCRFRDCHHRREPDCAIVAASARGEIAPWRLAAFHRLCDELRPQKGTAGNARRPLR
jgi:ribosome biogenesis GTPase